MACLLAGDGGQPEARAEPGAALAAADHGAGQLPQPRGLPGAAGEGPGSTANYSLPEFMNFVNFLGLDRFSGKKRVWTFFGHPLSK